MNWSAVSPGLIACAVICSSVWYRASTSTRSSRTDAQTTAGESALSRYDFSGGPVSRQNLPGKLTEISGLAVSADGRLFAHNDERALIYELGAASGEIVKSFALGDPVLRGDFEGLAIADGRFYMVTSDGIIYETHEGRDGERVPHKRHTTGLGAECEIEGAGYDLTSGTLLLACKNCRRESLCGSLTVFRWSTGTQTLAKSPFLRIPLFGVARSLGSKSFHPSGIERDPRTGNYLILAANERAIVEFSPAGKLVASAKLAKQWHPQSEGITVMPDLTLVVSDEGAGKKGRRGTLSMYKSRDQGSREQNRE